MKKLLNPDTKIPNSEDISLSLKNLFESLFKKDITAKSYSDISILLTPIS